MRAKPSLDEFRTGGGEEPQQQAPRKGRPPKQSTDGPEDRITKTIRIARAHNLRLKEEVLSDVRQGEAQRSESDLIDEALTLYWKHLDKRKQKPCEAA